MQFPVLEPLVYNLPAWYARSKGITRFIRSIHRRGGKDVHDFSMTVQDAVEHGGTHYYLFPTRKWAEDVIFNEQFTVNGITKSFWEWAIPDGLKAQKRDKDCCIILPHNGARIQLGGTDDLSFVGRGGKSYTMSEFSLHKSNVTSFIAPILRQSQASFRANGTLRGTANQLYQMLRANENNPDWLVQWLRPEHTKCYCWISDDYNINPELFDRIGEIGPNMAPIFNVQDDIDSGMISKAMARQEYLNRADTSVAGAYYGDEMAAVYNGNRIRSVDPYRDLVYTFWDLGGKNEENDSTAITFAHINIDSGEAQVVDYYESSGKLRGHYWDIIKSKNYRYGGHYFPHDGGREDADTGESSVDTAYSRHGQRVRIIPKSKRVADDIEIVRRGFAKTTFNDTLSVSNLITHLGNYHEKETTGKPCHKNNCSECHGASHGADSFRQMRVAIHLGLVEPYLDEGGYSRRMRGLRAQPQDDLYMIV